MTQPDILKCLDDLYITNPQKCKLYTQRYIDYVIFNLNTNTMTQYKTLNFFIPKMREKDLTTKLKR